MFELSPTSGGAVAAGVYKVGPSQGGVGDLAGMTVQAVPPGAALMPNGVGVKTNAPKGGC